MRHVRSTVDNSFNGPPARVGVMPKVLKGGCLNSGTKASHAVQCLEAHQIEKLDFRIKLGAGKRPGSRNWRAKISLGVDEGCVAPRSWEVT